MGDPAHEAHHDSNHDLRSRLIKARDAEHVAGVARKGAYAAHLANPEDTDVEAAWNAAQKEHVAAHEAVNRAARALADQITGTTPERQEPAMHIVDVDVETTGLSPDLHEIWEIGAIVEGHPDPAYDGEWWWQVRPDLSHADPQAMRLNRFYERNQLTILGRQTAAVLLACSKILDEPAPTSVDDAAATLALLLNGARMYAAIPHFEASFLDRFLRGHGQVPTWHHRIRCYESMTEGHIRGPAGGLRECAEVLGIEYDAADLHTALGDARLGRGIRRHIWDTQG